MQDPCGIEAEGSQRAVLHEEDHYPGLRLSV